MNEENTFNPQISEEEIGFDLNRNLEQALKRKFEEIEVFLSKDTLKEIAYSLSLKKHYFVKTVEQFEVNADMKKYLFLDKYEDDYEPRISLSDIEEKEVLGFIIDDYLIFTYLSFSTDENINGFIVKFANFKYKDTSVFKEMFRKIMEKSRDRITVTSSEL